MKDSLAKFVSLRKSLTVEKATLEARLNAINAVLGDIAAPATSARRDGRGGKRTFSAATKAKMAIAQQARWAKIKGSKAAPVKTKKRTMSAEGRARIAAAAKARWAKAKAAGQKTLKG